MPRSSTTSLSPFYLILATSLLVASPAHGSTPNDPDFFNSVGDEDYYEPYDHDLAGKDAEHRDHAKHYERAAMEEDLAEQDRLLRGDVGGGPKDGGRASKNLGDSSYTKGTVILAFVTLVLMAGLAAWLKRKKIVRKKEGIPPTPDMRAHQGEADKTFPGPGMGRRRAVAPKENHFLAPPH
ncbi:hypothetical protein P7C70_g2888, partial [Phenoliferia sp. Uapishka_3]